MEKHSIRIRANAKINLTLEVLGRRGDGYHELRTVMHSVGIFDELELEKIDLDRESAIERVAVSCDIPLPENNTVRRAAEAYFSARDAEGFGVRIRLKKSIPSEAGLGGASADAAAVLFGMEKLFGALDGKTLYSLGKSVGADVPFCLHGGCALCEGIGERLTALPPRPLELLIVRGQRGVSTGALFRSLDESAYGEKPDRSAAMVKAFCECRAGELPFAAAPLLMNDLAPAAKAIAPEIGEYVRRMLDCGALGAEMTGSGACVYGVFESEAHAHEAYERFEDCAFRAVVRTVEQPFEILE